MPAAPPIDLREHTRIFCPLHSAALSLRATHRWRRAARAGLNLDHAVDLARDLDFALARARDLGGVVARKQPVRRLAATVRLAATAAWFLPAGTGPASARNGRANCGSWLRRAPPAGRSSVMPLACALLVRFALLAPRRRCPTTTRAPPATAEAGGRD